MKNLNEFGVQEMDAKEMKKTDGGEAVVLTALGIAATVYGGLFAAGFITGVGIGLAKKYL